MPWNETCRMDERTQLIARVLAGEEAMTALCREHGISRKTGYKWLERYRCEVAAGLQERSHAPLRHGQALGVAVVQAVLRARSERATQRLRRQEARGIHAASCGEGGSAPHVLSGRLNKPRRGR